MSVPTCAVHVIFTVKPEHKAEFHQAVMLQAKTSLEREPWCVQFDVCTSDAESPNTFMLYETYDDRAAFEKHRQTEHLAEFNATIGPWVETRNVTIWDIS